MSKHPRTEIYQRFDTMSVAALLAGKMVELMQTNDEETVKTSLIAVRRIQPRAFAWLHRVMGEVLNG